MINEWPVAFPAALPYSVRLAGVAPDKENISCEYLCCLFKAKARCLHKVIRLYTRTERHTSAEREREKEKHVKIRQHCSPLILTSLTCPFPFSSSLWLLAPLPPYKQLSSLVMPLLMLYGQTCLSLHMALGEGMCHVRKCEKHYNIRVNSRTRQQTSRLGKGGGGVVGFTRGRTCSFSHEKTHTHTHTAHKNMCSRSFQQRAVVFCKTFPLPHLCVWDIPLNLTETCLKTDPCFHSVFREKGGGEGNGKREHGETKLEQDEQSWTV